MQLKKYRQHWHPELKRPNITAKTPHGKCGVFCQHLLYQLYQKVPSLTPQFQKKSKKIFIFLESHNGLKFNLLELFFIRNKQANQVLKIIFIVFKLNMF